MAPLTAIEPDEYEDRRMDWIEYLDELTVETWAEDCEDEVEE